MRREYRVKRFRGIAGIGILALEDIPKEATILEYKGRLIPVAEEGNSRYLMAVNSKWTIDGTSRDNLARYVNHSCRPNAYAKVVPGRRVIFVASRRIRKGEEVFIHYGKEYFNELLKGKCRCEKCAEATCTDKA